MILPHQPSIAREAVSICYVSTSLLYDGYSDWRGQPLIRINIDCASVNPRKMPTAYGKEQLCPMLTCLCTFSSALECPKTSFVL